MVARGLNTSGAEALHAFTWNLLESVVKTMQSLGRCSIGCAASVERMA